MEIKCFLSKDTNPYRNLAREEAMLLSYDETGQETIALFLWQNAATVVIGRNQNAWRECRTALMREEGCALARRTTGGGAVFHDLGNLNFSFLLPRRHYDLHRQLSVIQDAVRSFGIDCQFSGRNDLLAEGKKFSGNAFRFTQGGALHHGTLLVDVDIERMTRYLAVSAEKLEAKGVKSVPSRVINLGKMSGMTIGSLITALWHSFCQTYGEAQLEDIAAENLSHFASLAERNETWDWNYGATPRFDICFDHRFPWGGLELNLSLCEGYISQCKVYTDAMDADLSAGLEAALMGSPFTPAEMKKRMAIWEDIGEWIATLSI